MEGWKMARPKKKIDPECGKRVQWWINECQIKQYELADLLGIEKESMNNIIKGRRNLTYENAVEISKKVVSC
jgi:plasmid maintenance system antidote protein VapI